MGVSPSNYSLYRSAVYDVDLFSQFCLNIAGHIRGIFQCVSIFFKAHHERGNIDNSRAKVSITQRQNRGDCVFRARHEGVVFVANGFQPQVAKFGTGGHHAKACFRDGLRTTLTDPYGSAELGDGAVLANAWEALVVLAQNPTVRDGLERVDARMFQVVQLRYFAGLTVEEAAEVLEVSPRTGRR